MANPSATPRALALTTFLLLACRGGSGNTTPTGSTEPVTVPLAVDASGVLQSAATATVGETTLTLPAGTTITVYENGAPVALPASVADAAVTLSIPEGDGPALDTSATLLARRRITLTAGGAERVARFAPPAQGAGPTLTFQLRAGSTVTLALLFDVTSSRVRYLGSAPVVAAGASARAHVGLALSAVDPGGGSADLTPEGTGDLDIAGGQGSNGGAPGSGPYWTTFNVPAAPCVNAGGIQICGPTYLREINVDEQSTTDIMGTCFLGKGVTHARTGVLSPGYEYFCDVAPGANGGFVVTISGTTANLPIITDVQSRIEDGLTLSKDVVPAAEGLHCPDGSVRADPYTETSWKYGASKVLTCKAKGKDKTFMDQRAYEPLVAAGYDVQRRSFKVSDGYATEDYYITETLDGRLKIAQTVLRSKGWKTVSENRNTGTYEFNAFPTGVGTLTVTSAVASNAPDGNWKQTNTYSGVYSFRTNSLFDYQACDFVYGADSFIRWSDSCWYLIADPAGPMSLEHHSEDLTIDAPTETPLTSHRYDATGELSCSRPRLILLAERGTSASNHAFRVVLGTTDVCATGTKLPANAQECDLLDNNRCTSFVDQDSVGIGLAPSLQIDGTSVLSCQTPPRIQASDIDSWLSQGSSRTWDLTSGVDCVVDGETTTETTKLSLTLQPTG